MDGTYCFDQICTELEVVEAEAMEKLRDVVVVSSTFTSSSSGDGGRRVDDRAEAGGVVFILK